MSKPKACISIETDLLATSMGEAPSPVAARVAALEQELRTLQNEVAALRVVAARKPVVQDAAATKKDESTGDVTRPQHDLGVTSEEARRFLQLYVQSFARDPKGSEYFRLAVAAVAYELLDDLARLIRDPQQPLAMRQQMIRMLATQEFRGDRTAITALLDAARAGPDQSVSVLALHVLRTIGTAADAAALEQLIHQDFIVAKDLNANARVNLA